MKENKAEIAKQLWLRAHVHIKNGVLPHAIRDLAKSFELLKELSDPRMKQVYDKWVTVYNLYEIEKNTPAPIINQNVQQLRSQQAAAEALVNSGELEQAIAIYEKLAAEHQDSELVLERLAELKSELAERKIQETPADLSFLDKPIDLSTSLQANISVREEEDSLDLDVEVVSKEANLEQMQSIEEKSAISVEDNQVYEMTGEDEALDERLDSVGSAITLEPQPASIQPEEIIEVPQVAAISSTAHRIQKLEQLSEQIKSRKRHVA